MFPPIVPLHFIFPPIDAFASDGLNAYKYNWKVVLMILNDLDDELWTSRKVADYLGVHIKTVQGWVRDGRIPAMRLANQYLRFRRSDVEALLTPVQ